MTGRSSFRLTFSFLAGWDFQALSKRLEALTAVGAAARFADKEWNDLPSAVREKLNSRALRDTLSKDTENKGNKACKNN